MSVLKGALNRKQPGQGGLAVVVGIAVVVVVIVLFIVFSSLHTIAPGYVGIIFDKSRHTVSAGVQEPGYVWINSFNQSIQEYPVTVQTYDMVAADSEGSKPVDDSVKVQSNEGQQINLDVVIQYQVNKEQAGALYQDWGGAEIGVIEDRVVRQYTRSQVPLVASRYGWEEITSSKRGQINDEISAAIKEEFAKRHLTFVSFAVREVHLPQNLQAALDQKIAAQQQAEQQKYQLAQAQVKAEQAKVEADGAANAKRSTAQGDADAAVITAKGEAQSITTRAQAQAAANQQLAQSVTPALINYITAQKWDGKVPQVSSGTTPFVNIPPAQ